jgi:hypothetical protein
MLGARFLMPDPADTFVKLGRCLETLQPFQNRRHNLPCY